MAATRAKLGIWLVGASGNIAVTVATGLAAFRKGLAPPVGLCTERSEFGGLGLVPLGRIALGGHEVRGASPLDTAKRLHAESGLFGDGLLGRVRSDLASLQRNIRPGTAAGSGPALEAICQKTSRSGRRSGRAVVDRLARDMRDFQSRRRLDGVVVVNVASTEPQRPAGRRFRRWSTLNAALGRSKEPVLPASSLYAIAAIESSMPYVNFTPSLGDGTGGVSR